MLTMVWHLCRSRNDSSYFLCCSFWCGEITLLWRWLSPPQYSRSLPGASKSSQVINGSTLLSIFLQWFNFVCLNLSWVRGHIMTWSSFIPFQYAVCNPIVHSNLAVIASMTLRLWYNYWLHYRQRFFEIPRYLTLSFVLADVVTGA